MSLGPALPMADERFQLSYLPHVAVRNRRRGLSSRALISYDRRMDTSWPVDRLHFTSVSESGAAHCSYAPARANHRPGHE